MICLVDLKRLSKLDTLRLICNKWLINENITTLCEMPQLTDLELTDECIDQSSFERLKQLNLKRLIILGNHFPYRSVGQY